RGDGGWVVGIARPVSVGIDAFHQQMRPHERLDHRPTSRADELFDERVHFASHALPPSGRTRKVERSRKAITDPRGMRRSHEARWLTTRHRHIAVRTGLPSSRALGALPTARRTIHEPPRTTLPPLSQPRLGPRPSRRALARAARAAL